MDIQTDHAPAPLLAHIKHWPDAAQARLWACRALFHQIAQDAKVGRLDETLKWGQPSWRPVAPRTGSTLRAGWHSDRAQMLSLFVDCKTDLAARMRDFYPHLPLNDGRRHLAVAIEGPLPQQALSHLAEMTFTYHRARRLRA